MLLKVILGVIDFDAALENVVIFGETTSWFWEESSNPHGPNLNLYNGYNKKTDEDQTFIFMFLTRIASSRFPSAFARYVNKVSSVVLAETAARSCGTNGLKALNASDGLHGFEDVDL